MHNLKSYLKSFFIHACNLVMGYFIGIILGNIIFIPYIGVLIVAFIPGGIILGLPLVFSFLMMLLILKNHIEKNLKIWCILAPLITVIGWLVFEYTTNYSNRFNINGYLSLKNVWERAALVILCASISIKFYYNRMKSYFENQILTTHP